MTEEEKLQQELAEAHADIARLQAEERALIEETRVIKARTAADLANIREVDRLLERARQAMRRLKVIDPIAAKLVCVQMFIVLLYAVCWVAGREVSPVVAVIATLNAIGYGVLGILSAVWRRRTDASLARAQEIVDRERGGRNDAA